MQVFTTFFSTQTARIRLSLGLPTCLRVKNASGTIVAPIAFSYDETAYPLLTYSSVTGWTDPGTTRRGNITTTGIGKTQPVYLQTHAQYDLCGNLQKTWDSRDTGLLNPSQITYSHTFSDGVPRNT
jgi:hypothetical protein